MTVTNRSYLLASAPIVDMHGKKLTGPGGTTYGLGEAGYDIRIKQEIWFYNEDGQRYVDVGDGETHCVTQDGRFALASAIEEFNMPAFLTGIVHDKSTWARRGLSVFNTVIEPGWKGFLTLELVYHGEGELIIPAGAGIAQVMFHEVQEPARYTGKYQNQADEPVGAIASE
jgi:dCTP deaminase